MRHSRRRGGLRRRSNIDRERWMRIGIIAGALVAVIAAVVFFMKSRGGAEETSASAAADSSAIEIQIQGDGTEVSPDNNQYVADYSQYELQKDEVPQVNQLISEYFQAKVDQDAETLYRLFGKTDEGDMEQRREELKAEAVYIEDYQNITCYTRPGLTADSYVAYVTYEVKFRRVDTLAPGLMWCYILKAEDGSYIIRENVVGEEADYVASQNQTEDVRLLSAQVNEQLRQAIESDTLLAGIYKNLRNGAVVASSEGDDGADSQVSLMEEAESSQESQTAGEADSSQENQTDGEADSSQENQSDGEAAEMEPEDPEVTIE